MYLSITGDDHCNHVVSMCSYFVDCQNALVMGKYVRSISVHHSKQGYLLRGKEIVFVIDEPFLKNILLLGKIKWKNSIHLILAEYPLELGDKFRNVFSERFSACSPTESPVPKILCLFCFF